MANGGGGLQPRRTPASDNTICSRVAGSLQDRHNDGSVNFCSQCCDCSVKELPTIVAVWSRGIKQLT